MKKTWRRITEKNKWEINTEASNEKEGKEKTYENYIELGNDPADVDKWISFGEMVIDHAEKQRQS